MRVSGTVKEGIHVLYKAKMGLFMLRIFGVPMYCMLYEVYAPGIYPLTYGTSKALLLAKLKVHINPERASF